MESEVSSAEPVEAGPASSRSALTSSASADWGSPELVRELGAVAMRPAAIASSSIDVDCATSAYWQRQWRAVDRPDKFFDGGDNGNALSAEVWDALIAKFGGQIGSAFCNPPGDPTGGNVKDFHYALADLYAAKRLDSFFEVGFSLEQLRSLIPHQSEVERNLLSPLDPRVCTIFPSSRLAYMVHPRTMIELLRAKLAKRKDPNDGESKRMTKRTGQLEELVGHGDESPVVGPSPTHSSYLSIYWSHKAGIKKRQQAAVRAWLAGQAQMPRSPFARAAVIGDIGS